MKGTKFLIAAIVCATFTLGISGISSAAELSTLQVERQELSACHNVNRCPPCRDNRRNSRGDYGRTSYGSRYGGYHRGGYGYSRNNRGGNHSRQININVRKVTIKV